MLFKCRLLVKRTAVFRCIYVLYVKSSVKDPAVGPHLDLVPALSLSLGFDLGGNEIFHKFCA